MTKTDEISKSAIKNINYPEFSCPIQENKFLDPENEEEYHC